MERLWQVMGKLNEAPKPSYEIFGSDGYSSYALYMSISQKIYLCEIDCQTPAKYIEITSANMLYTE